MTEENKEFEKEDFEVNGDYSLEWYFFRDAIGDEKKMPEWDCEGVPCKPKTKEEWKQATLWITTEEGLDTEIQDLNNSCAGFDIKENITPELITFLEGNGYEVDIDVSFVKKTKPLQVSKMGRKKIVNIPSKSDIQVGDNVKVLRGRNKA